MKRLVELFQILLLIAAASVLLARQDVNPAVGTWKLNVAESKFDSTAAPKSATRTVEEHGDGMTVSYDLVTADGGTVKWGFTAGFDDKDSPITGSGTGWRENWVGGADTIALRRLNSSTIAAALKKGGSVVMTSRVVVSKSGKVTTLTMNGADAKGQPTKNVLVWDKQ